MSLPSFDPRLTLPPYKSEESTLFRVRTNFLSLYKQPVADYRYSSQETELLHGETINVIEWGRHNGDTWALGQSVTDGYVGYCKLAGLDPNRETVPTHRISTISSHAYKQPDMKMKPLMLISYGSKITVIDEDKRFFHTDDDLFIPKVHAVEKNAFATDPVDEALRFVGVPYVWGGRSGFGLDCSALVQLTHAACGIKLLRDADMQAGVPSNPVADDELQRGDLMFFTTRKRSTQNIIPANAAPDHVGLMIDNKTMLHASPLHMAVAIDPLEDYLQTLDDLDYQVRHYSRRLPTNRKQL
jgi:cell wall-associated NlpC family hydrolase